MDQEPLVTEREVLEAQTPQYLARFVLQHGERISQSERMIALAGDVLTAYGTSIETELDRLNETKTDAPGA